MLEEHTNKQNAKRDESMDETAASSFSPPPQPPGGPRARRNARRAIMDAVREAAADLPVVIRDRSRSRNPEPIIEEPKEEKEKHVARNI